MDTQPIKNTIFLVNFRIIQYFTFKLISINMKMIFPILTITKYRSFTYFFVSMRGPISTPSLDLNEAFRDSVFTTTSFFKVVSFNWSSFSLPRKVLIVLEAEPSLDLSSSLCGMEQTSGDTLPLKTNVKKSLQNSATLINWSYVEEYFYY